MIGTDKVGLRVIWTDPLNVLSRRRMEEHSSIVVFT